jgi:putative membrane protein
MSLFAEQWNYEAFGMSLLAAGSFGVLGIALLALGFKVFEWITPKLNVEEELAKGNVAVAVMIASVILGVAAIVIRAMGN